MLLIYPEIVIWAIYLLEAGYAVPDMQGRTKGDYISTRARQCFGVNTSALKCIGASRGTWNAEEGMLSAGVLEMLDAGRMLRYWMLRYWMLRYWMLWYWMLNAMLGARRSTEC